MTGDNITVVCSDVAGAEWFDVILNIQTTARAIDDLAYPATTGRSIVVDAAGLVDANAVKLGPTGAGTAQTARDVGNLVDVAVSTRGTSTYAGGAVASVTAGVTVATNSDKTGYGLSALETLVVQNGTAQAGAASTITLAAGASATDNLYTGQVVHIYSATGAGQVRVITGYVGATKVATVGRAWITAPDATSVYRVISDNAPKLNANLEVTTASVSAGGIATSSFAVGAIDNTVLSSNAEQAVADKVSANAVAVPFASDIKKINGTVVNGNGGATPWGP